MDKQTIVAMLVKRKETLNLYDSRKKDLEKLIANKMIDEMIEGASLASFGLSDMPRSQTNKITSRVEIVAETYTREMKELMKSIISIDTDITHINNMLNCIREDEKFIIEKFYFEEKGIERTTKLYNHEYDKYYHPNYIVSKKDVALNKMLEFMQKK